MDILWMAVNIAVLFGMIWYVESDGWKLFLCGYALHVGETMFRYGWRINESWVDLHWSVGLLVALSAYALAIWRMDVVRKRVNLMINGVK